MIPGKISFQQANVQHRQNVNFATKNGLTSNIYNQLYLSPLIAFGRFPRKHSW